MILSELLVNPSTTLNRSLPEADLIHVTVTIGDGLASKSSKKVGIGVDATLGLIDASARCRGGNQGVHRNPATLVTPIVPVSAFKIIS